MEAKRSWLAQIWIVAGCILMLGIIPDSSAVLKENDSCKHHSAMGTCRPYSTCRDLLQGQRITICSYNVREAIVCCPNTGTRFDEIGGPNVNSAARVAIQKCAEYRKLSFNRISVSTLTLTPTVVSFEVPKCDNIIKLIVGGNVTKPGEFPHMAAIGWRLGGEISFNCGGSLISNQFLLTAAHCYVEIDGQFPSMVRLGDQNLVRQDDGAKPIDVDIERFIRHPSFKRNQGLYNDIALIKLIETVQFTNFIRPACLYDQLQVNAEQAIATGFGLTEDHGDKSDELLKVSLNIYSNDQCSKDYANSRQLRQGIMQSQMCVGYTAGGRDTCQGDSGGPLQITKQENHCVFYIIGITSFGQTCGSPVPAIYSRVAAFLDWIEPIVWGQGRK